MAGKPFGSGDDGDDQRPGTMLEDVYAELRRSLMTGVFLPGERVSLRRLAVQMGTSLMPVREAVNRLVAERAFEVMPNRQIQVPSMTEERFDEIERWRIELESAAVRMAVGRVSTEVIDRLRQINDKMVDASSNDRREELLPSNYDFHFTVYRQSGSTVLLPMIESLWLQQGPFTFYSLPSPKVLWDAEHHEELIAALEVKDEDRAAAAVAADISRTGSFLKQVGFYQPPQVARIVRR